MFRPPLQLLIIVGEESTPNVLRRTIERFATTMSLVMWYTFLKLLQSVASSVCLTSPITASDCKHWGWDQLPLETSISSINITLLPLFMLAADFPQYNSTFPQEGEEYTLQSDILCRLGAECLASIAGILAWALEHYGTPGTVVEEFAHRNQS